MGRERGARPNAGKRLKSFSGWIWAGTKDKGFESSRAMSGDLQLIDILVFAMIAGFLFLRLHRVLGKRTGNEQPPSRLTDEEMRGMDVVPLHPSQTESEESPSAGSKEDPIPGIQDLKASDPTFRADEFVIGVETAFEMIVEAFGRGDTEVLEGLLDEQTLRGFEAEIERRSKANEEVDASLISIESCQVVEVQMKASIARITVNIVSKQIHAVRNGETGEIVEGDEAKVGTVNDLWTFARDIRSQDPNWQLVETRLGN